MCFAKLFGKKPLRLPHPEEPVNYLYTIENTDIKAVIKEWLAVWQVPEIFHWYWLDVDVQVSIRYDYPAVTFSETREMFIRPEWANPGVLSHENSHISYSLLTQEAKANFEESYKLFKDTSLIKLVTEYNMKKNSAWRDSIIEIHADCYRYLGSQLPDSLKAFYPRLFSSIG